jgi:hypothetical protein
MILDIDNLPDPNKDLEAKLTERVRGEPKELKFVCFQKLQDRPRTWMIKRELLEVNPHWIEGGLVASSGVLWGEDEPVEDTLSEKRKKAQGNNGGRTLVKKVKITGKAIQKAEAAVARELGGIDIEMAFVGGSES